MGGSSRSNRTLVRPARHRRGRTRLMPVHDGMNNLPRRVATSQAVGDPALWRIRVSTGRCAPNIGQSRAIRAAPGAPGSDAIDAFTDRVHVLSLRAIRPIGVQRADPAETVALNRHVALALHQPCLVRSAYTWVEGVGRRFRSLAGLFLDGARRLTRGRLALLVSLASRADAGTATRAVLAFVSVREACRANRSWADQGAERADYHTAECQAAADAS